MALAPTTNKVGRFWLWQMGAVPWKRDRLRQLVEQNRLPITDLPILLNDSPMHQPTFKMPKRSELIATFELCRELGITPHLYTWMNHRGEYARRSAEALFELAADSANGIGSLGLDLEGEFIHRQSKTEAERFTWDVLAKEWEDCPVPCGITSFAGLPGKVKPAVVWVVKHHNGYGMPQAYAAASNSHIPPRELVAIAKRTWQPVVGSRCVPILAVYGKAKGLRPGEALEAGISAIRELTPWKDVSGWTLESADNAGTAGEERRMVLAALDVGGQGILQSSGLAWGQLGALGLAGLGAYGLFKYFVGGGCNGCL